MVAVENATRFHEMALSYERQEPLGIRFHHASIACMAFLADARFDAVVADYVLMDVLDLELRDLDEPEISEEARRSLPPREVCAAQRAPISYVLRIAKLG